MCHALIIEDEPVVAFHIADLIEEAGATTIDLAQSEIEAINAALLRKPDIILSDVRLFEGSGPAAVAAIRHEFGQLPVIFITASPECLRDNLSDAALLPKPFNSERLKTEFARLTAQC